MSLAMLALLVVTGVAIIMLFLVYIRRSKSVGFEHQREVLNAFYAHMKSKGLMQQEPRWWALSEDGRVGLVQSRDDELAVVVAKGKPATVRLVRFGDVRSSTLSKDGFTVSFRFMGVTSRTMSASFDDVGVALYAKQLLETRIK